MESDVIPNQRSDMSRLVFPASQISNPGWEKIYPVLQCVNYGIVNNGM